MNLTQTELARIFRALAAMLHAGISPAEGLWLLSREEGGDLSRLLADMGRQLEDGARLSETMEWFPVRTRAMVAVGEETGRLEEALSFLAEDCDESVRTARMLRQSFSYPLVLFGLMLLVIGLLLTRVMPIFDRVYGDLGIALTGIAGSLLVLGQWLQKALPLLAVLVGVVLAALAAYSWIPAVKNYVNLKARTLLGDRGCMRKFNNARFARALAMGIGSGLNSEESLSLAKQLLASVPGAAQRCAQAEALVNGGTDLAEALEQTDLLPPARGRMLAVGLRSGNVDRILEDVADRMEQDARQALEDRLATLEPALVLVTAVLVGLILLSVMMPLLDILTALG